MGKKKSVFFDVTITQVAQSVTGIQRVVDEVAQELQRLSQQLSIDAKFVSFLGRKDTGIQTNYVPFSQRLETKAIPEKPRTLKLLLALRRLLGQLGLERILQSKPLTKAQRRLGNLLGHKLTEPETLSEVIPSECSHLILADSFWSSQSGAIDFAKKVVEHGGELSIFCYDIIPISHPELFTKNLADEFTRKMSWAIANASRIIVNSKWVKTQILDYFPFTNPLKIAVIPLAASPRIIGPKPGKSIRQKKILVVGTIEPRKNYKLVLEWWRRFGKSANWEVTIIGRPGWGVKRLVTELTASESNKFRWFSAAGDQSLFEAMASHHIGLSASFEEGFGLPAWEMGASGMALALSDISVYRELHQTANFFNPYDPASLDAALEAALHQRNLDTNHYDRSWSEVTEEILSVLLGNRESHQ